MKIKAVHEYLSEETVEKRIAEMGAQISEVYGDEHGKQCDKKSKATGRTCTALRPGLALSTLTIPIGT